MIVADFRSKINMECLQWSTARSKTKRFLLRDKDCGCDSLGWGNDFTLDRKDTVRWNDGSEALEAAQRHTTMEQLHYVPYNYGMMQRMAQFCKQRGIRLVIITTPCCSEYNNNLDEKQLALMYKMTRKLCRENGLPYLDYLRDSRFTADDFFDSNHLSEIGAARFTDILDKDLQKLK